MLRLGCCAGLSSCDEQGLLSQLPSSGFSLRSTGCRHVGLSSFSAWAQDCGSKALEHSLGRWGAWAWLLQGLWHIPGSGIEPVSPALARGFIILGPPGKALTFIILTVHRQRRSQYLFFFSVIHSLTSFICFCPLRLYPA